MLTIGLIYVFPHLYFIYSSGQDYKGIYISRSYDEESYIAQVRQVYDTLPVSQNPYLAQYSGQSVVNLDTAAPSMLGWLGKTMHLSIANLAIAMKFVLPMLIFLAAYAFLLELTGSSLLSAVTAFAILLGQELAPLNITSALRTFSFQSPFDNFLFFNRPINPQVSAIFFFLGLWALAKYWNNRHSFRQAIIAGIFVGIQAYVYFFYWDFSMILAGVVFLYALISRDKAFIKTAIVMVIASLIVSGPFIFEAFRILQTGSAAVTKNYILTHRFVPEKVILLPLLVFIIAFISLKTVILDKFRGDDKGNIFIFLLVLAGLIASNQQVIHGYEIQQFHYHFMTNISVFIIFICLAAFTLFERFKEGKYAKYLVGFIIVIVAWHGISVQAASYVAQKSDFIYYQKYGEFFDWLNENSKTNDVVYADWTNSEFVPVYTKDSVYSSYHAPTYPVPLERLEHNYFVYMYLEGVTKDQTSAYFRNETNRNQAGQFIFEGQYYRALCGSFGCFPDSILEDLIAKYKNFLNDDFETNLEKYKIDYVFWDKNKEPRWHLEKYAFLKPVLSNGGIILYRVSSSKVVQ